MRRITLLTDFGTRDGYVAAMKGVIARLAPAAIVDDAAHDIDPGDVPGAAWTLGRYWAWYPESTIHVVVVDPGVGGPRRAIAARIDGRYFVGPDNGLLSWVLESAEPEMVVGIADAPAGGGTVSATFHGRDVFAPAAARLAAGVPLESLGAPIRDPVRLPLPKPVQRGEVLEGDVVHVDRYGNLITNVPGDWLRPGALARVDGADPVPLRRTYSDVGVGDPVAVIGSASLLEISVRDGSAAARLGAGRGGRVEVRLPLGSTPSGEER